VDDVTIFKGLADIGETETIYDELSGLSSHQWSPIVPARTFGVKGAQIMDGLRGLFMRPQSPATPSLGEVEVAWRPAVEELRNGVWERTWTGNYNFTSAEDAKNFVKKTLGTPPSAALHSDGSTYRFVAEQKPITTTVPTEPNSVIETKTGKDAEPRIVQPPPSTPESQVTTPETIQTNPDVKPAVMPPGWDKASRSPGEQPADATSNFLMQENIPGVPNYVPTALAVGGLLAAVAYIATRK
jgi:hypothetical protein